MSQLYSFLRLIRYPNLLFIILTQAFLHYLLVVPILRNSGMESALSNTDFWLLSFSTVLIAAAGYIINDYFDVKIDSINKPKRIFIDRTIKRRVAMLLHWIFTGVAVVIGAYLSWKVGNLKLSLINPLIAALLWYYSTGYKKQPVIGNLVVSFLTGMVVLVVVLYEPRLFKPDETLVNAAAAIFLQVFFYFVFAFLVSLIREIVKDMEDIKGDETYGCRTLPIIWGIPKTKLLVHAITAMVIGLVLFVQVYRAQFLDYRTIVYLAQTVQFPLLMLSYILIRSKNQRDYNLVSSLAKIVMLMGILTILYLYFYFFSA